MDNYKIGDKLAKEIKPELNENYSKDEEIEKLKDLKIDYNKLPSTLLITIAQTKEIPEKDFIKILIGDLHLFSSKWKFELNCYGVLNKFKNKKVVLEEILKGLINKELLNEEMDGTLRITKKIHKALFKQFLKHPLS